MPATARAQLSAAPDPLDFGSVRVGNQPARQVTLSNSGLVDLAIDGCAIDAPAGDFSVTDCPAAVAAGGTAEVTVRFAPQARGSDTVTLRVTWAAGTLAHTVTLTGTGVAPDLRVSVLPAPGGSPIDFGAAPVGRASPTTYTFRVENAGDALLDAAMTAGGADPGDWSFAPPGAAFSLAAGAARDIEATFTPGATGARSASLTFTDQDGLSPDPLVTFALSGTGGESGLTLSPTALTFGAIDVQTGAARVRTLTVGNTGSLPLEIARLRLEDLEGGPYDGLEYQLSTGAPLVVPAGGEVTVEVSYRPLVESEGDYAVLVLETDSPEAPEVEITLSGRGLDRHIAVSDLDVRFPATYRNPVAPAAVPLRVDNTGQSPLRIDAVMVEGEGFSIAGELPAEIPPLGSATVELRFAPPATGELTGALLLVSDDDDRPTLRVDLGGAGVLPPLTASVAAIDFGSATVDLEVAAPGHPFVTLVNTSEVDSFTVQAAQVTGPDGRVLDGYDIHGLRRPVTLEPGGQLVIEVLFHPARAGDFGGTLEVLVDADPLGVPLVTIAAEAVDGSLRGSGCAAGGSGAGGGLVVLFAALLLGRRRARLAALPVLFAAGAAAAQVEPERQTRNLDLSTFRPAHSIEPAMLTVESTAVGQPGAFAFDVWIDYARNPLVVETAGGEMVDRPIADRTTLELAGSYAFGGRFEVSGALPVLSQGGDAPQFSGIAAAEGSALGDLRLRGKAFLLSRQPLSFGAAAEMTLPTATDAEFAGAQGPSAAVRLLADTATGPLEVAVNAGALMRQRAQLADVEQGHQFVYGLAGAYRFSPQIAAIGELFGAIDIGGGPAGGKPLEAVLGGRYRVTRAWALVAGGGRGLLPGIGSPDVRLFAAVAFAPRAQPPAQSAEDRLGQLDGDQDGVPARDDRCGSEAEDRDGFADGDGCPDPDDDGDRVADRADRCPRDAEDADQHEDADGCPDPDNDGDGIADAADGCPGAAEDADSFADQDGCPDPDNDRDGVADAQDRCPAKQETINGNADDDGCPDAGESLVFVTKDRLELFEPIRFKGDTAELTRASVRLLGQVGATLRANPDIVKLHIRVHVDRRGKEDDALTVRRAEAVRRWLAEWGIDPARLEGVGFGSRFPLGKGRAINDRVELEIKRK